MIMETSRIRLRPCTEGDKVAFRALNADPEVMRFFPAPLEQAEAGGVAHAGEEQGHKEVFDILVKGELDDPGEVQGQMGQGEDQAAHHRGGDATFSQKLDAVGKKAAQDEQEHGDARRLVHIQTDFDHNASSSLQKFA